MTMAAAPAPRALERSVNRGRMPPHARVWDGVDEDRFAPYVAACEICSSAEADPDGFGFEPSRRRFAARRLRRLEPQRPAVARRRHLPRLWIPLRREIERLAADVRQSGLPEFAEQPLLGFGSAWVPMMRPHNLSPRSLLRREIATRSSTYSFRCRPSIDAYACSDAAQRPAKKRLFNVIEGFRRDERRPGPGRRRLVLLGLRPRRLLLKRLHHATADDRPQQRPLRAGTPSVFAYVLQPRFAPVRIARRSCNRRFLLQARRPRAGDRALRESALDVDLLSASPSLRNGQRPLWPRRSSRSVLPNGRRI